jgi:FSR family fosmidomycin resistance protein-like MFS transporter
MGNHPSNAAVLDASSAPDEAEANGQQLAKVFSVSASHAVHDLYATFLSPLLPHFIANMALSKTEAGLLPVIRELPSLFQPVMGHASDRLDLRTVIFLAPATTAIFMSLIGIAPNYLILALLLLGAGASGAAFHAVAPTIAGSLATRRTLGRFMGIWMVGGEIGFTLGPILIATVVQYAGLSGTPWLMFGGIFASLALFTYLRKAPKREVVAVVDRLAFWPAFRQMLPVLLPLAGVVLARAFMTGPLTTFLPIYLSERGSGLWFAGASISIVQAAGTLGALLGGSISDRLGRRTMIAAATALTPLVMFVFLSTDGWAQIPLLLILGFLAMSEMPVLLALVQESFPQARGMGNGAYLAMSYILRSLTALVLGTLGDLYSMRTAFIVAAIVPLAALPLIYRLPKSSS